MCRYWFIFASFCSARLNWAKHAMQANSQMTTKHAHSAYLCWHLFLPRKLVSNLRYVLKHKAWYFPSNAVLILSSRNHAEQEIANALAMKRKWLQLSFISGKILDASWQTVWVWSYLLKNWIFSFESCACKVLDLLVTAWLLSQKLVAGEC